MVEAFEGLVFKLDLLVVLVVFALGWLSNNLFRSSRDYLRRTGGIRAGSAKRRRFGMIW